jgi:hypothetical protein
MRGRWGAADSPRDSCSHGNFPRRTGCPRGAHCTPDGRCNGCTLPRASSGSPLDAPDNPRDCCSPDSALQRKPCPRSRRTGGIRHRTPEGNAGPQGAPHIPHPDDKGCSCPHGRPDCHNDRLTCTRRSDRRCTAPPLGGRYIGHRHCRPRSDLPGNANARSPQDRSMRACRMIRRNCSIRPREQTRPRWRIRLWLAHPLTHLRWPSHQNGLTHLRWPNHQNGPTHPLAPWFHRWRGCLRWRLHLPPLGSLRRRSLRRHPRPHRSPRSGPPPRSPPRARHQGAPHRRPRRRSSQRATTPKRAFLACGLASRTQPGRLCSSRSRPSRVPPRADGQLSSTPRRLESRSRREEAFVERPRPRGQGPASQPAIESLRAAPASWNNARCQGRARDLERKCPPRAAEESTPPRCSKPLDPVHR